MITMIQIAYECLLVLQETENGLRGRSCALVSHESKDGLEVGEHGTDAAGHRVQLTEHTEVGMGIPVSFSNLDMDQVSERYIKPSMVFMGNDLMSRPGKLFFAPISADRWKGRKCYRVADPESGVCLLVAEESRNDARQELSLSVNILYAVERPVFASV